MKLKIMKLFARADDRICVCERDPSLSQKILGLLFVISQTDPFSRIKFFDIVEIPSVISEDSKAEHDFYER